MNTVQPIREQETIDAFFRAAQRHDRARRSNREASWELILLLGLNSGYRVSDFGRYRVRDLIDAERFTYRAKKTGKETRILIRPDIRREIKRLLNGRDPDEYVFQSKKRNYDTLKYMPITRQRFYQILNSIAAEVGYKEKIGCHTLRKTFGYWYYKNSGHNVAQLMEIFGHSDTSITLRYIGISSDEIDDNIMKLPTFRAKRGRSADE